MSRRFRLIPKIPTPAHFAGVSAGDAFHVETRCTMTAPQKRIPEIVESAGETASAEAVSPDMPAGPAMEVGPKSTEKVPRGRRTRLEMFEIAQNQARRTGASFRLQPPASSPRPQGDCEADAQVHVVDRHGTARPRG
jgi:hypothetical protein